MNKPPPIARQHCRHYSYPLPITCDHPGPQCAVGLDISAPGAANPCMPNGTGCAKREDWTAAERVASDAWQKERTQRVFAAIADLPPLKVNQSQQVDCPNCEGKLSASRGKSRVWVSCSTQHCVDFSAQLAASVSVWPEVATDA